MFTCAQQQILQVTDVPHPQAQQQIAKALRVFTRAEALPAIIHCRQGKDRTGIMVALLLLLLGVDEATVVVDYTKSNLAIEVCLCCSTPGHTLPSCPVREATVMVDTHEVEPGNRGVLAVVLLSGNIPLQLGYRWRLRRHAVCPSWLRMTLVSDTNWDNSWHVASPLLATLKAVISSTTGTAPDAIARIGQRKACRTRYTMLTQQWTNSF